MKETEEQANRLLGVQLEMAAWKSIRDGHRVLMKRDSCSRHQHESKCLEAEANLVRCEGVAAAIMAQIKVTELSKLAEELKSNCEGDATWN